MKNEILIVSNFMRESVNSMKDLCDDLNKLGIQFTYKGLDNSIKTENYIVYGVSINSNLLTLHNHYTKYYLVNRNVDRCIINNIFSFGRETKELNSVNEILGILDNVK